MWLRSQRDGPFDLVLLDPPYSAGAGLLAGVLGRLARTALAPGALVVLEASTTAEPRRYGGTTLYLADYVGTEAGTTGG